ncbi:MAG TPA: HEAT repeat domain-containing protein [Candidatus Acidoferrum sp.]|nr:HEAT repeat domain-containing protein [Candidatus Acidoferrum sp.]
MSNGSSPSSSNYNSGPERRRVQLRQAICYASALVLIGSFSLVAGFETARTTLPDQNLENSTRARSSTQSISTVRLPSTEKKEIADFNRLPPQLQAERLLERAMHDDPASLNLLRENVDTWRGRLKNTDHLFDLVLAALNSADLRVRTAAVDVDLAANNLSKSPESVTQLLRQMERDPAGRGMALWRLGSLGNRGVDPERVLNNLLNYAHNPSEHTRYWAVEGLAMLGNDATIDPLLDRLAHDPSPRVRERAASSLGQSGLLTREERLAAVPHLLNFADDDSLNTTTRELVYGTLRVITGAPLGNDAGAWREWWAHHDPAHERPRHLTGVLRA